MQAVSFNLTFFQCNDGLSKENVNFDSQNKSHRGKTILAFSCVFFSKGNKKQKNSCFYLVSNTARQNSERTSFWCFYSWKLKDQRKKYKHQTEIHCFLLFVNVCCNSLALQCNWITVYTTKFIFKFRKGSEILRFREPKIAKSKFYSLFMTDCHIYWKYQTKICHRDVTSRTIN